MGWGAEIRLRPHRVNPKAHDSNGLCVNVTPGNKTSLGLKRV